MPQPSSLVAVNLGGESFPYRSESRCKLCTHKRREDVERLVCQGQAHRVILRDLDLDGELSVRNLSEHLNRGHLPLGALAVREVARQRGEQVRQTIQPMVDGIASNLSFAHAILDKVRQRLESGECAPTVRDGLAAARLIAEAEAFARPHDVGEWQDMFIDTYEIVQAIMTSQQFEELGKRLDQRQRELEAAVSAR